MTENQINSRVIENSIADAIKENPDPLGTDQNPFANGAKNERSENCSDISGTGGPSRNCKNNSSAANRADVTRYDAPENFCPNKQPSADGDTFQSCTKVPGWSSSEPYNHSTRPAKVHLWNKGVPLTLIIPGSTAKQKWGIKYLDGKPFVQQWNGETSGVRTGASTDDGCALTLLENGWPSPRCQKAREEEWIASNRRRNVATSKTESQCRQLKGEIIDPNAGAISEKDCSKQGGTALYVFDPSLFPDWYEGMRGCFIEMGHDGKWNKLIDPKRSAQCKVKVSGRVEYYAIRDNAEDEANPFAETPK